ncbi:MAG: hypothetical protein V5A68_07765 [Candidatus Thermoplasmatota archaeon]
MNKEDMSNEKKFTVINKKTVLLITVLIALGIITGVILSNFFIIDANQKIKDWNENMEEWSENPGNFSWGNWTNNNSSNDTNSNFNDTNMSHNKFDFNLEPISIEDAFFQSIGVISVCITSYLLAGLIITYIKIFLDTRSQYILGLLLVLGPLFVISLFFLNTLRALFFSAALKYSILESVFGFGVLGLGGIITILSIFEIIGFVILLVLSRQ